MDEKQLRDKALFEALDNKKKKRRRKIIRTVIIAVVSLALLLVLGVNLLQRQVRKNFASRGDEVVSYTAARGSVSTSVSGSGALSDVDLEEISVPAGVEIEELVAEANTKIMEGEVIATLDMASVMTAMSNVQDELDSLDAELVSAANDNVSSYISSGVQGRVKTIYAREGMDIAECIYENGALAVMSLDGYMAVDIESEALMAGDSVIALRADGSELEGLVEKDISGSVTVLVSDYEARPGELVEIKSAGGEMLGSGELYIHSPLKITGISGTVSGVYVYEDQMVYSGSSLFYLTETGYSAGYEATLRERNEKEETLQELVKLYQDAALRAPFSGTVSSLDYDESAVTEGAETLVVTMSPDKSMSVTINVDESDIMSLELGQRAQISIDSVGEDVFEGELTEINRSATSSSGVTRYTAVVTLDKTEKMLSGMTAEVLIRISGVDNAIIIPVAALHQTSSTAFVYTEYNEDTGEYGGMVEVIPGISNSSYVEISSGLEEGDTVWYTEEESFFGAMGGGFPGGGAMPGGMEMGEMPEMDFDRMPSEAMGGGRPDFGSMGGGMPGGGFPG